MNDSGQLEEKFLQRNILSEFSNNILSISSSLSCGDIVDALLLLIVLLCSSIFLFKASNKEDFDAF